MNAHTQQPTTTRVAKGDDRAVANKLIQRDFNVDLLEHEQHSGARVSFVAWPPTGEIQSSAALVMHRDGTTFVHLPSGVRTNEALSALYSSLKARAIEMESQVVLALIPSRLEVFSTELISHGFRHIGDVLTMRLSSQEPVRTLARFAKTPTVVGHTDMDDARLAELIQSTYEHSLSDPSLGTDHSAMGFLNRLRFESADHRDRLVLQVDGEDAAVCLLSRYDTARYAVVRYLGVAPQFRGRKLGSQILAASLAAVWSDRYQYVSVDVDDANRYAKAVYQEVGFQPDSRAAEFILPLD
ncbi:MAG: GNAT family N-acetyltransferase [Planctomycetaceae bacterium]